MPLTADAHNHLLGQIFPPGSSCHLMLLGDDRTTFSGAGTASSSIISLPGHDLAVGDRVIASGFSGLLPSNGAEYFVASSAVDQVELSATFGGNVVQVDVDSPALSLAEQGLGAPLRTMASAVRKEAQSSFAGPRPVYDYQSGVIEVYEDTYDLTVELVVNNTSGQVAEFEGIAVVVGGSSSIGDTSGSLWLVELLGGGPYEIKAGKSRTIPVRLAFCA